MKNVHLKQRIQSFKPELEKLSGQSPSNFSGHDKSWNKGWSKWGK